jgi:hypothetical protein
VRGGDRDLFYGIIYASGEDEENTKASFMIAPEMSVDRNHYAGLIFHKGQVLGSILSFLFPNPVQFVGFEFLAAVIRKYSVFCVTTPCGTLKINRGCEGRRRLHLQSRRISQGRHQREAGSKQSSGWFLPWPIFQTLKL